MSIEITESYEELLQKQGFILKETSGTSMEPMLHEGQELSLIRSMEAMGRDLKCRDVVLYKRNGKYVLHRVVSDMGDLIFTRGDNCSLGDIVRREDVIGILAGFYRGDTFVDCEKDEEYLRYVRRLRIKSYFRNQVLSFKNLFRKKQRVPQSK